MSLLRTIIISSHLFALTKYIYFYIYIQWAPHSGTMVAWWKELCHPFYSPLLHMVQWVEGNAHPLRVPPLLYPFTCFFSRALWTPIILQPKRESFQKGNQFCRSCLKEKSGCCMCCIYTHCPPKPNQPKDNNKTQTKQEAHKKIHPGQEHRIAWRKPGLLGQRLQPASLQWKSKVCYYLQ